MTVKNYRGLWLQEAQDGSGPTCRIITTRRNNDNPTVNLGTQILGERLRAEVEKRAKKRGNQEENKRKSLSH